MKIGRLTMAICVGLVLIPFTSSSALAGGMSGAKGDRGLDGQIFMEFFHPRSRK